MRIILLSIILLISFAGSAQLDLMKEGELESLEQKLYQGLFNLQLAEDGKEGYDPFDALVNLGNLYRSKRNYTKAFEYYEQSLGYANPQDGEERLYLIQNKMGRVLFANAQYEEAIEVLEEAGELDFGEGYTTQIDSDDLRARAFVQLGKLEAAKDIYLETYDNSLNIIQDTSLAIEALTKAAEVSNQLGQFNQSLEILSKTDQLVISCNTDPNIDIFLNRAYAYNKRGRSKEAINELIKAESSGLVYNAEIQNQIAQIYLNIGKEKDALSYINKAIDNALVRNDKVLLRDLYVQKSGLQNLTKNYKGSLESVKASSALVEKVKINEILDESKRLRIQDYMVNVENEFRQITLEQDLKASDKREIELKKEADQLKEERARLEKEKSEQELELLKEREAVNEANLRSAELDRKRIEQEAHLLREQNIGLQRQRELEQLDELRTQESLKAAKTESDQLTQIALLEQKETQAAFDAAEKEATLKRNRLWAILMGVGLLVAILTVLNTRRLNKQLATKNIKIEDQRVLVEKERERAEQLLLNVLPKSIAEELKINGVAAPEKYESATVLFTDFVGFTSISSSLAPEEIIEELNLCFTEFDKIAGRHRIEKIKTIGDSYMCAGGIPDANDTHASDAVRAGQEMVAFMDKRNAEHKQNGNALWPIRIGIHTGELVAGVVGSSKFAYDIWGDTVNVASRMERGAEHDSINISEETYQLIKDHFDCQFRGEIDVKNKGLMGMYRVA